MLPFARKLLLSTSIAAFSGLANGAVLTRSGNQIVDRSGKTVVNLAR